MKHKSANTLFAVLLGTGFSLTGLQAQNPFFAPGDLVLFFQKPGDDDIVMVGLGNTATLYRGSAAGPTADRQALNIVNISAALTTAYGAGWATDPDIYSGLAGALSASTSTTLQAINNGDQKRTLYTSRARNSVGTLGQVNSSPWDLTLANSSTGGATAIVAMGNIFEVNYTTQVAISPTSVSSIETDNPFLVPGTQATAFNAFQGGVQQVGSATAIGTFGPAGPVEFALDLNRIVPLNDGDTTGEVSGVKHIGSYEGTIVVGTDGNVSFITQGTGSAYDTWIGTFNPPLTNASDRLSTADPDNDGYDNLEEFVLNGNPSVSSQAIAPTLNASGADFVFSFTRRDDSLTEAPALFQYGSDLSGWTDVPVATSGSLGAAGNVVVTPGDAVTDGVVVTLSKSVVAVGGKLFGRLKIVK